MPVQHNATNRETWGPQITSVAALASLGRLCSVQDANCSATVDYQQSAFNTFDSYPRAPDWASIY